MFLILQEIHPQMMHAVIYVFNVLIIAIYDHLLFLFISWMVC